VRAARVAAVVVLLAAAFVLAALAVDVLHWRDAMRMGDRELAASPADAAWHPSTVFPASVGRDVLGLETSLRLRRAMQTFAAVRAAGSGYDNGLSESRARGVLEADLSDLALARDHAIASDADNLLGILAYTDATQSGPIAPAPVDQSVADFQAAVRADPTNADAKFNLELLLHDLLAKGTKTGPSSTAGGPAKGHHGAGGGIPGRGY
jgi:hypothetical protein